MKIGVIADIHGNFVGLEAVLGELERAAVDQVVCLGDVCVLGPWPRECLRRLLEIGCPSVLGNTDDWLLSGLKFATGEPDPVTADLVMWCAVQLSAEDLQAVRAFQSTIRITGDAWSLECFHGSPHSYNDVISATTPDGDLEQMLAIREATVWAGGHTHVQMLRRFRDGHVINPGSAGLPGVGPGTPGLLVNRNIAWAEYAIVTLDNDSVSIDLRRTPLDMDTLFGAARDSGMPHLDWWLNLW